jgi:hypothetical protein
MTVFPKARSVTQANMIAGRNKPEERRLSIKGVMENRADRGICMAAEQGNARTKSIYALNRLLESMPCRLAGLNSVRELSL